MEVEFIRFKPSLSDVLGVGTKVVRPKEPWENGYRFSLDGLICSTFFQLSYLRLHFQESLCAVDFLRTKTSDDLSYYVYQMRKGFLQEYQGVFDFSIFRGRNFRMFVEGGVNYANLHVFEYNNSEVLEDPFDAQAELHESFWGIGPEMGWKWKMNILSCVAIENSFRAALLSGKNRSKSQVEFGVLTQEERARLNFGDYSLDIVRIVPFCQMKVGVNIFSQCCICGNTLGVKGEVGYEIQYFYQALLEQPKIAKTIYRNFSWQGLFLSFALFF